MGRGRARQDPFIAGKTAHRAVRNRAPAHPGVRIVKVALLIVGLVAAYLVGQLLMFWHSRHQNLPKPPAGGWKQRPGWEDEDDDWPTRPPGGDDAPPPT